MIPNIYIGNLPHWFTVSELLERLHFFPDCDVMMFRHVPNMPGYAIISVPSVEVGESIKSHWNCQKWGENYIKVEDARGPKTRRHRRPNSKRPRNNTRRNIYNHHQSSSSANNQQIETPGTSPIVSVNTSPNETSSSFTNTRPNSQMSSSIVLGIDLGTTNSCAAIYRQKRESESSFTSHITEVLTDFDSAERLVPSIVSFASQNCVVGVDARDTMKKHPDKTFFEIKRFIGRRFNDEVVQQMKSRYPFRIVELSDGFTGIRVNNQTYRSEEISARVLSHIRTNAINALGQTNITKAVITVPAYFNDDQRQATQTAAEIAGFEEITLINEPTAAALSLKQEDPSTVGKRVLVFDFGGGTFDVSIVDIKSDDITVIGTHGSTNLGGANIDQDIVDHVMKNWITDNNCYSLPTEKKKSLIAFCDEAEIEVENFASGNDLELVLTKDRFDAICAPYITKCLSIIEELLQSLRLQSFAIDYVQLVGGSSRLRKVQEMLELKFPGKVRKTLNPDQSVAAGAAAYFHHVLHDVTPHSLGISIKSKSETNEVGTMSVIIPRHSSVPCMFNDTYVTTADYQTSTTINVYQGEASVVSLNTFLARFRISNLPPLPAGEAQISTTMIIDSDGILHVEAEDLQDKSNTASIKIERLQSQFRFSP
ncbi:hypothetical protein GEMRC1_006416 [Eukaryota sp. GEM-RC1]